MWGTACEFIDQYGDQLVELSGGSTVNEGNNLIEEGKNEESYNIKKEGIEENFSIQWNDHKRNDSMCCDPTWSYFDQIKSC